MAETLRVLLYEHVSSGGFAGASIPPSLLSEGFGMLRGLASDFCAAGHDVTALLDSRIATLSPPIAAEHVVQVFPSSEISQIMEKSLAVSDAVFVVAPESNHLLQYLVERNESSGVHSLNSRPDGIEKASNKRLLAERIAKLGFDFPKTLTFTSFDNQEIEQAIKRDVGFPAVFKPLDGAGCAGISLVSNRNELHAAVAKVEKESSSGFAVQEFIEGVPTSVSLICTGKEALPVSLNLQDVTLASPEGVSSYNGGVVPLEHPQAAKAYSISKRLIESFGNLRGYVGVDLILTGDKLFVMEINPRLTTSYVGLRRVSDLNLAETMTDAVIKGKLPEDSRTAGVACFTKVPVLRPIIFAWQEMCSMEELISPPFPLANEETSCGILQSYGETTEEAFQNMREAKVHLHDVWMRGQHPW